MANASEAYVHISRRDGAPDIRTGPSTVIPELFVAEIDDSSQPYSLELRIQTFAGRQPEVLELRMEVRNPKGGGGISTQGLRNVHVARALELAVARATEQRVVDETEETLKRPASPKNPVRNERPLRGIRVSEEFLSRVAGIYRDAVTAGSRAPVAEVARQLGSSRSTAGRWVVQARRAGILKPALGTRAGEAHPAGRKPRR